MNNYTVYKHTSPSNKVYIGITCNSVTKRWKNGEGYNQCPLFYNAILKYGWDNIKHEILYAGLSSSEAKQMEKDLISQYKSNQREFGYNLTNGGDGSEGYKHSEETKQKMRDHHPRLRGKDHPLYGKPLSEEHKQKLREARKNQVISEETRRKIGDGNRGKFVREESKLYGEKNYSFGRFGGLSAVAKPVLQLDDGGNIINRWDAITTASRALGISNQCINKSLHKPGIHAGGFLWKYDTDSKKP